MACRFSLLSRALGHNLPSGFEMAPEHEDDEAWSVAQSVDLYQIKGWGDPYFHVNDRGHVEVVPNPRNPDERVDLYELMLALEARKKPEVLSRKQTKKKRAEEREMKRLERWRTLAATQRAWNAAKREQAMTLESGRIPSSSDAEEETKRFT